MTDNNSPAKKTKRCPHCAEQIQSAAKKCRYCNEWLDGREAVKVASTVPGAQPSSSLLKRVGLGALIVVVILLIKGGYWVHERDTEAGHISDYTNAIAEIFSTECPSLTRTTAYEMAAGFRDDHLEGNADYCSDDVSIPLSSSRTAACLRGPPKGYPPLDRVRPVVRAMAQATCAP